MKREKNLETILAMCFGFLILHLVLHVKALLTLSILLAGIGLFSTYLTEKITWLWLKISEIIGSIMGKVLMGIVFFVFLTPIAFLMKISGKVSVRLKKENGNTIYEERNHTYTASDIENIW